MICATGNGGGWQKGVWRRGGGFPNPREVRVLGGRQGRVKVGLAVLGSALGQEPRSFGDLAFTGNF